MKDSLFVPIFESKINKYLTIGMNMAPTYIVQDGSGQANGKDSQVHQALYATRYRNRGRIYDKC